MSDNYHLRSTPSLKKDKRQGVVRFHKLDKENFKSSNKIPTYKIPHRDTDHIPSLPMDFDPNATARDSIMERALHNDNESQETKDEIIRKSKCLAPAYPKGAYQYISDETLVPIINKK